MIDFLKTKSKKAYDEIVAVAEHPDLLFSTDPAQYHAEARYNQYTVQKIHPLIKKRLISVHELEQAIGYIERSWSRYLSQHFPGRSFAYYVWCDLQIPAIRMSVVSAYEGLELPFGCVLRKVHVMHDVFARYIESVQRDGTTIRLVNEEEEGSQDQSDHVPTLAVYSKKIPCSYGVFCN